MRRRYMFFLREFGSALLAIIATFLWIISFFLLGVAVVINLRRSLLDRTFVFENSGNSPKFVLTCNRIGKYLLRTHQGQNITACVECLKIIGMQIRLLFENRKRGRGKESNHCCNNNDNVVQLFVCSIESYLARR